MVDDSECSKAVTISAYRGLAASHYFSAKSAQQCFS